MSKTKSVYGLVTAAVIGALEKGKLPWVGKKIRNNLNVLSKAPYRGVNIILTANRGFESPLWISVKQVDDLKFTLDPEQKGKTTTVVFCIRRAQPDGEGSYFFYTTHKIYNIDQMSAVNQKIIDRLYNKVTPIHLEAAKLATPARLLQYINESGKVPAVQSGATTIYSSSRDAIIAEPIEGANEADWYWSTFKAIAQATNAKKRVPRKLDVTAEKLACEIAAAFLCAECEIKIDPAAIAAMAEKWRGTLTKNSGLTIIRAAREATKIAEYLLGKHSKTAENDFKRLLAIEAAKMLAA